MIIDSISRASAYYGLAPKIEAALKYLQSTDFSNVENGRHDIQGDDVYALVMDITTKLPEDVVWEAHRRYIDIQYVIDGTERMGYADIDSLQVTEEYDESKDAIFFKGDGTIMTVPAGTFVLFAPQDGHKPGLAASEPATIRKAVVKVRC